MESWDSIPGKSGKLTKETFTALHHTTYTILELTQYCTEELKLLYILPGKFQTDHLEARFGPYRQLSGDQYNISICQVFECEKKLTMLSILKLSLPLNNQSINLMNLQEVNWNEMTEEQNLDVYKFNIDVTDNDVHQCKEDLSIIIYLAGYCCYAVFKKMKCYSWKSLVSGRDDMLPDINSYFQGINRGSLLYPNDVTTNLLLCNYIVINKLVKNPFFLHSMNQRKLSMYITLDVLANDELLFHVDSCGEGHSIEKNRKMIVWSSSNALLNNFLARKMIILLVRSKKRKLQTFNWILRQKDFYKFDF